MSALTRTPSAVVGTPTSTHTPSSTQRRARTSGLADVGRADCDVSGGGLKYARRTTRELSGRRCAIVARAHQSSWLPYFGGAKIASVSLGWARIQSAVVAPPLRAASSPTAHDGKGSSHTALVACAAR